MSFLLILKRETKILYNQTSNPYKMSLINRGLQLVIMMSNKQVIES